MGNRVRGPKCNHVPTCLVSSHANMIDAAQSNEPMASTQCCDRDECINDAKDWVNVLTHKNAVVIPFTAS